MSKGKSSGSTTQTSSAQPWQGAQPYLLGYDQNSPGVFPGAVQQYQNGSFSPDQQAAAGAWNQFLQSQQNNANNIGAVGNAIMWGNNNAQINPVGPVEAPGQINAQQVAAQQVAAQAVDPTQAFASLGGANPMAALQNQLSGSVNNPYLDQQIAAIGTDISNNLNRNVLPGLRSQAVASGQYGGSRQGIAEGLAAQGATQQLANQSAMLRGNAYEAAQNRQGTAASNLSNLGISNSTNNANRDLAGQTTNAANSLQASLANQQANLQAQMANTSNAMGNNQFNANLGLQNNSQAIANSANNTSNATAGANLLAGGLNYGNGAYGQQLSNLGLPQQQNWQNLLNYANVIQGGAGLGSTSTSSASAPGGSNPIAGIIGGGLAGQQLIPGPAGLIGGASLGLLNSLFR